jgi:hypothetical protein
MPLQVIFQLQMALGYLAGLLFFTTYMLPRLRSMDRFAAQRVITTIHSFRFFGLVFFIPGVVGPNLPASFANFAAWGDFATGVLALLALLTVRIRPLFWSLVAAFNVLGVIDILVDYYHAMRVGLPDIAGQLGSTYFIPVIYVPLLMITHVVALYWLLRPQHSTARQPAGIVAAL